MSSSPDREPLWRVAARYVSLACLLAGILVAGFLLTQSNSSQPGQRLRLAPPWELWELGLAAGIALLGLVGIVIFSASRSEQNAEQEARLRLRRAEDQLSNSLRGADIDALVALEAAEREALEAEGATAERELEQENRLTTNQDQDRLALPALWELTHSRLDLYHTIATSQARRSFLTAQVAIGGGFALLVAFAVVASRTYNTAGAITAGALGAVSAALAGYISRTFVRSQEAAASHLRAYFDQPLEFSRYLAAERLLSNNANLPPDKQAAILTILVEAVISPEPSPNGSGRQPKGKAREG